METPRNILNSEIKIDESKEKPKAYKDCAALAGIGIVVAAVVLPAAAAAVPGPAPGLAGPGSAAAAVAAPSTNCAPQRYP